MEQILMKELIQTAIQQLRNFELNVGTLNPTKPGPFIRLRHFFVTEIQITMMPL